MEPVSLGVLASVVANALSAIAARGCRFAKDALGRRERVQRLLEEDPTIAGILRHATVLLSRQPGLGENDRAKRLQSFLVSPDAEAIARQVFSTGLAESSLAGHLASIRSEFRASLALHLREPEAEVGAIADELCDALVAACDRALDLAVQKNVLAAHEAKAAARHRAVQDELAAIRANVELLAAPKPLDLAGILRFEELYRGQVAARHAYVTPPHFDQARRVPIDDIYVAPTFSPPPKGSGEGETSVRTEDLLPTVHRTVVLGSPGSGKSTLAQKLCHDLSTRHDARLLAEAQLTPVLVVLREYGAQKRQHNCSIMDFMAATARSRYQVVPPDRAFEYLFLNGRAAVVFDGLDELLDTTYRQEVTADVESFCNLFPALPVIVTSREVGYGEAPLDERRFDVFRLRPFDEDQVEEYAQKWFALEADLLPEDRSAKADALLQESRSVEDLRSNPLMLALMCNLYRGEGYIPRNRPDVYQKCADMLFERWDKSRGIHVVLPFEAHIRPAIMSLAHSIYCDERLQGGAPERTLVDKAAEYLHEHRFEDAEEARGAAADFVRFCRGRAWVLSDVGTTRSGERLYKFTHRTFMEYFTAAHIVRTHPTPKKLLRFLRPHLRAGEWDVVAQLALQLQSKSIENAADDLLTSTVASASTGTARQRLNLLSFAARSLEFLVPRPRTTRQVARTCLERYLAWGSERVSDWRPSQPSTTDDGPELLVALTSAGVENCPAIGEEVVAFLADRINRGPEPESVAAIHMALNLPYYSVAFAMQEPPRMAILSSQLLDTCWERMNARSDHYFLVCYDMCMWRPAHISRLVRCHGAQSLFLSRPYLLRPNTTRWAVAACCLDTLARGADSPSEAVVPGDPDTAASLAAVGAALTDATPPWCSQPVLGEALLRGLRSRGPAKGWLLPQEGDAAFGAFALVAMAAELEDGPQGALAFIGEELGEGPSHVRSLLRARFLSRPPDGTRDLIARCRWTAAQRDLASLWIRGESRFVE